MVRNYTWVGGVLLIAVAIVWASIGHAGTAQVSIDGARGYYTVEFVRNGQVIVRDTNVRNGFGQVKVCRSVPDGDGYYARVWHNAYGIKSNTWPPKTVSGTTHLGCLRFNYAGEPIPWVGPCPVVVGCQ
jgi:hypothetical protein